MVMKARVWTDEFGTKRITDEEGNPLNVSDAERVRLTRRLLPSWHDEWTPMQGTNGIRMIPSGKDVVFIVLLMLFCIVFLPVILLVIAINAIVDWWNNGK
jgi:hypothetical protein